MPFDLARPRSLNLARCLFRYVFYEAILHEVPCPPGQLTCIVDAFRFYHLSGCVLAVIEDDKRVA